MTDRIRSAEIVVPCAALAETLAFFTDRLGFRVDAVLPADDPAVAIVSGHGVRLRLDRHAEGDPGALRLLCDDPARVADGARELTAPNGMRIELVRADPPIEPPPVRPSFVLTRAGDAASWTHGRAGMDYRDLIPDRQGGAFIASHIRIPGGGPVPDYVHFHRVRFQMIFCRRGWVRVVYEDQGAPFVMHPGDCVLQPPGIRHRVLESSAGLEVVEISSPADHETRADHALALPTDAVRPDREFDGQRFARHVAAASPWSPGPFDGLEHRETGVRAATGGLASVVVARAAGGVDVTLPAHQAELAFAFVLSGSATLQCQPIGSERICTDDAFVIPPGTPSALVDPTSDFEFLRVTVQSTGPGARR